MLKFNVKVCGAVSSAPVKRTSKKGEEFSQFVMSINLKSNSGKTEARDFSVSANPDTAALQKIVPGAVVEVVGKMTIRKVNGHEYINISADEVSLTPTLSKDEIVGTLLMHGTIGKKEVVEKKDKKGEPYILFSAYSSEKRDDTYEYTWCRFLGFGMHKEDWMQPRTHIAAEGKLEMSIYGSAVSLSCILDKVEEYTASPAKTGDLSSGGDDSNLPGGDDDGDLPF